MHLDCVFNFRNVLFNFGNVMVMMSIMRNIAKEPK